MGCCRCLFWTCSVLVAVLAVIASVLYYKFADHSFSEEVAYHLGEEGVQIFKAFDRNDDNYLSAQEFEPLFHSLIKKPEGESNALTDLIYDEPINPNDEVVTLVTSFKPLLLDSMSRAKDDSMGGRIMDKVENIQEFLGMKDETRDALFGLRSWQTANHEWKNFGVSHFQTFFPRSDILIGDIYSLVSQSRGFLADNIPMMNSDLSSNRYFPPFVKDSDKIVYRLLQMFHPRPFIMSRFQPRGSIALIRARNDKYMEIVFRIHAEFQLNELPNQPFWFTPAQFTGSLIVSRDLRHIVHFNMFVPADKKLNVDMEWLEGQGGMVVDIGYMPQCSMVSSSPSVHVSEVDSDQPLPGQPFDVLSIEWTEEISQEEALRLLEVKMYPFKQVRYYNLSESLALAKEQDKFMHHILLWGALDDQSC